MNNEIKVGDKVTVNFVGGGGFHGVVHYIPAATGDAWHIRETDTFGNPQRELHYVQSYEDIVRLDSYADIVRLDL